MGAEKEPDLSGVAGRKRRAVDRLGVLWSAMIAAL